MAYKDIKDLDAAYEKLLNVSTKRNIRWILFLTSLWQIFEKIGTFSFFWTRLSADEFTVGKKSTTYIIYFFHERLSRRVLSILNFGV